MITGQNAGVVQPTDKKRCEGQPEEDANGRHDRAADAGFGPSRDEMF